MTPDRFAPLPPEDAGELLRSVRLHDEARALSLAFVSDAQRASALTACAFVAEAAGVPARVSEPMIGLIRVQWWREALAEAFGDGTVRAHPLVKAIRATLAPVPEMHTAMERVLDAVPPFLEGGAGAAADLLRSTDGAMGAMVARIVSQEEGSLAGDASTLAALAAVAVAPPPPARSPQIETPRQRAARVLARDESDLASEAASLRAAWPRDVSDGAVLGALPFALTRAHAAGRVPGPFRTRIAMMRMVATGRP